MATLTSAQVMGVDKDRGVIAAGKLADMVLVDGDPSRNIADIDKVATVIKGGKVYDPARSKKRSASCRAEKSALHSRRLNLAPRMCVQSA